jgi:hypothetical protein
MHTSNIVDADPENCRARQQPAEAAQDNIVIYENAIPEFVERELEQLYESIYCTLARFHVYDSPAGASTYVARDGEAIRAIFLFRRHGGEVRVLNQQITVARDELERFARTIFARYQPVRLISFYAIAATLDQFPFVHQRYVALEENILQLPANPEQYLARMSSNLRSSLQRAEKKIQRAHPSFEVRVLAPPQVTEDLVRGLIAFAAARMAVKRKQIYIGEQEADKLMRMISSHGFVVVATIDGQLCGGSIWYSVGGRDFMHINAHDPRFDQFMLGNQVLVRGILHCIKRGGRECWLMGGFGTHKAKFKAAPQYLETLLIYRSRLGYLFHCRRAGAAAARIVLQRLGQQLQHKARGDGPAARFFALCLQLGRSVKRRS